jgi:multicomponent Na+:H+ antiporter subunit E
MSTFLLNILLAVTWGMATGQFTVSNLAFGFALGYLILRFSRRVLGPSAYFDKVPRVLRFALRYLSELVLANIRVAYDVLVPGAWTSPGTGRARAAPPVPSRRTTDAASGTASPFADSLRAPFAPASYLCPGVVAIPLDARTDAEITLLANLITLTPGSVSLDLSEDRRVLYVHAMYIDGGDVEAYRRSVKEGLERRVLELLR